MRIGIVGGAECSEHSYRRIAEQASHELEFHAGATTSTSSRSLQAMIKRCDVVVITTDVNSHNAVRLARSLARQNGRRAVLCRRFGVAQLRAVLEEGAHSASA